MSLPETPEQKLFRSVIQLAVFDANRPCTRSTFTDPIPISATLFLFSNLSPFPSYAKLLQVDYKLIRCKLLAQSKFLNLRKRYFYLKRTDNLHNKIFYQQIAQAIDLLEDDPLILDLSDTFLS